MRGVKSYLVAVLVLAGLATTAFAQYDPCLIPTGHYRTQTQGGWHTSCSGHNPGCIRDTNFPVAFPSGLTVGGIHWLHFTSSTAVKNFLPGTGTAAALTANATDPASGNVFAGQVVTLSINVAFGKLGLTGWGDISGLIIPWGYHTQYGPLGGWRVDSVLSLANKVLGGDASALPLTITLPDLNDIVTHINECFDNGTSSTHYVVEPNCDERLPVEIASFGATGQVGSVDVRWSTASENGIANYEILRSARSSEWTSIALLRSQGNSPTGFAYSYDDANVEAGVTYSYRLVVHSLDGSIITHDVTVSAVPRSASTPLEFALEQNYPNPFNPSTTIAFTLPIASHVRLAVFNLMGREVAVLANDERAAGSYAVNFDASSLAGGVYFYRLEAGDQSSVRKLMLLK